MAERSSRCSLSPAWPAAARNARSGSRSRPVSRVACLPVNGAGRTLHVTHLSKTNKHLPNVDQTITLCHPPDYNKRDANFKVPTAGAYIFSAGWSQFIRDNEVQEGDAFALEASKIERRLSVTVHSLQGSHQGDALKV
ncbi:hypothetical protein EJB05_00640, partial [Eragrostis curvula]